MDIDTLQKRVGSGPITSRPGAKASMGRSFVTTGKKHKHEGKTGNETATRAEWNLQKEGFGRDEPTEYEIEIVQKSNPQEFKRLKDLGFSTKDIVKELL